MNPEAAVVREGIIQFANTPGISLAMLDLTSVSVGGRGLAVANRRIRGEGALAILDALTCLRHGLPLPAGSDYVLETL